MRILLTSDMHDTDLETWYGVSNEDRLEHWLRRIHEEHGKMPFDLILIPGDISLDYHNNLTPFDKGYSTAYAFVKKYVSRLPAGVPVLIGAVNHEQFPDAVWEKITGNPRQCHWVLGGHTFIMLDGFREALGKGYDSTDAYSPMDVGYIRELMERYPDNRVWLASHYFEPALETGEFRNLVASDSRIKGLFMGHTHEHQVISLGEDWGSKTIAQTGNFSYTMSGAQAGGFWGFRDLVIDGDKAVSRYIMVDSDVVLEEGKTHFDRWVNEIVEYALG